MSFQDTKDAMLETAEALQTNVKLLQAYEDTTALEDHERAKTALINAIAVLSVELANLNDKYKD